METTAALSWRTSSYSSSNGGDCVEVGAAPHAVAVRDSKDPAGPVLAFTPGRWQDFTRRLATGRELEGWDGWGARGPNPEPTG